MMRMNAECILKNDCILGEGPWWDGETNSLWWIDGLGDVLFCYTPKSGTNLAYTMRKHIGCVVKCKNNKLLLNLQDGIYTFDPGAEELICVSNLERKITNNRLNDGNCDSHGRFWFGSMSMTANQPGRAFETTGSFYSMETDGTIIKWFDQVGISNGIAWDSKETTMYYIDSPLGAVNAFDFDLESGYIANRREIIRIDSAEGIPDGMCADKDDNLWVAHFGGNKVSKWNPKTGERLMEILLPVSNVTCCAFGGELLDTLYITTAREGLSPEQTKSEPLAGGLFCVRPGVEGLQAHIYGG